MANWKKVIVSGSHAHLANITSSGDISALGQISSSGQLFASLSLSDSTIASQTVMYDTSSGKFYFTGSGTGGGIAVGFPYSGSDIVGGIGLQAAVISGSVIVGGGLAGNITASGGISASTHISASSLHITGAINSAYISASGADITSASLGSLYVDGIISSSGAISASRLFVSGNVEITGDVDAGSFSINGFTLLDNQNNVISGSNIFGSGSDPAVATHQFTGSLFVTGANITAVDTTISASAFQGTLTGTASAATSASAALYSVSASAALYSVSASAALYSVSSSAALYSVSASHAIMASGSSMAISASGAHTAVTASHALYSVSSSAALYSVSASAALYSVSASHAIMASGSSMAVSASGAHTAVTASHALKVVIGTPTDTNARKPLVFLDGGVLKVGDISPDQDGPTYDVGTNKLELGRAGAVGIELFGGNGTAANSFIRVKGDLFVEGSTTNLNVTDLAVEDKFILLNSHSSATPQISDAGIIVQTSGSTDAGGATYKHFGTALYYSQDQNRWVLAKSSSVEAGAGTITQNDGFLVSVSSSNLPVTAAYDPLNFDTNMPFGGGTAASYGMMYIDEGETGREAGLYIYMPGDLG